MHAVILFLGAFENCEKQLLASSFLSVCPSVRAQGTTLLPLEGFHKI
jgi:hypothetical protein